MTRSRKKNAEATAELAQPSPLLGVEIAKPPIFFDGIARRLRQLSITGIDWQKVSEGAVVRYFLFRERGGNTSGTIPLVPFIKDSSGVVDHWLAVIITLDNSIEPSHLTHASIQVFAGNATDEEKRLLIRAEWDPTQSLDVQHGQPHWHVHNLEGMQPTEESMSGFASLEGAATMFQTDWVYTHIHFAMASRFHDDVERCVAEPATEKRLLDWTVRAIEYLRSEMEQLWKGASAA